MRGRHRPGLGAAAFAGLQRARRRSGSRSCGSAVEGPERALLQGEGDSDGSAGQKMCNAVRWLLCQDVLNKYSIDPERTGISGDSAGGNLAVAVTQQAFREEIAPINLKVKTVNDLSSQLSPLDLHPSLKMSRQLDDLNSDGNFCRGVLQMIISLRAECRIAAFWSLAHDNVEEPWKIMLLNAVMRTPSHLAQFAEMLGLNHFVDSMMFFLSFQDVPPTSDENVSMTDTTFNNTPVRIYVPKRKPESLRKGLFYIHGGGWCFGSNALNAYDILSRWTANRLDAVVVSTNYRLAPKYHFPVQFEDVYTALKWFLHPEVLKSYGVDPGRVGISGDSAGGNLAAAVTLQLLEDPDVKSKPKIQSLIYPALQNFYTDSPSY
ncbi:Arylacetamide Deacetylase [Manis pentadactyla]|nr:Arylacetamide Deacetylase [Manis pentadactyla]